MIFEIAVGIVLGFYLLVFIGKVFNWLSRL
jgi:hypothetical protein